LVGRTLLTNEDLGDWSSSPDYALVRMAGFTGILLYGVG